MYLLYLRYKAFLIRHKLIVTIIFAINIGFLIFVLTIAICFLIKESIPNWLFGYPFLASACIFIPLCIVFENSKLTDLQKKILCIHLKTGYKRCDQIIETIIKEVRKRKSVLKFAYKGLEVSGLYVNIVDEPIVNPATINGIHLTPLIKYPMPTSDGENWLYLREFLVSYTDNPLDYVELEKSFFYYLS